MKQDESCQKALQGALFLCRKAGALVLGFDAVLQCLESDRAVLLLFAQDVSQATSRRLLRRVTANVQVKTLPFGKEELAMFSKKPVGVLCVTDENLASLCLSKM